MIIAIYVDDFLLFWNNIELKNSVKSSLCDSFKMKDLGKAKNCIGLRISYDDDDIYLDQEKYIREILARFDMAECKAVVTPADLNQKLSVTMSPKNEIERADLTGVPYQEAVGSLLYLAQGTRPDIAFAVNDVSRFNSNFGQAHWTAVKRVFRYLEGTMDYKLKYTKNGNSNLIGFSDADHGSDIDKRRSCTGYVFILQNGAISWNSRKQPTVAISTTEAEYMALSATIQEAIWLKQFGKELSPEFLPDDVYIKCDNQGAICLAENDVYRARTKHIDIKYHFIRDCIESKFVTVNYLDTDNMVADSLTKPVQQNKHLFCARKMGLFFK